MVQVQATLRIDGKLREQLRELAKVDHRSLNNYIEKVLTRHVYDVKTIEKVTTNYKNDRPKRQTIEFLDKKV